jgi:hypothetical protein
LAGYERRSKHAGFHGLTGWGYNLKLRMGDLRQRVAARLRRVLRR